MEYIDDYNFTVSFSGQLTLSGRYQHFYSEYTSAPEVMFWVDEASRQKLPQILEDARGEQSHFTLYPHARFAPLGSQGTATVVIDQYRLVSRERGGGNELGAIGSISTKTEIVETWPEGYTSTLDQPGKYKNANAFRFLVVDA
ncbi:MAG: hypothetical protein M1571_01535 [Firmicutes bacterium]|nr:hypothetical protein [Bacillota bacterium]